MPRSIARSRATASARAVVGVGRRPSARPASGSASCLVELLDLVDDGSPGLRRRARRSAAGRWRRRRAGRRAARATTIDDGDHDRRDDDDGDDRRPTVTPTVPASAIGVAPGAPRAALAPGLVLPDRHGRLQRVDRVAAGLERLGAVRRRHDDDAPTTRRARAGRCGGAARCARSSASAAGLGGDRGERGTTSSSYASYVRCSTPARGPRRGRGPCR